MFPDDAEFVRQRRPFIARLNSSGNYRSCSAPAIHPPAARASIFYDCTLIAAEAAETPALGALSEIEPNFSGNQTATTRTRARR